MTALWGNFRMFSIHPVHHKRTQLDVHRDAKSDNWEEPCVVSLVGISSNIDVARHIFIVLSSNLLIMIQTCCELWLLIYELSINGKPLSFANSDTLFQMLLFLQIFCKQPRVNWEKHSDAFALYNCICNIHTEFRISLSGNNNMIDLQSWNVRSRPPASLERLPDSLCMSWRVVMTFFKQLIINSLHCSVIIRCSSNIIWLYQRWLGLFKCLLYFS